MNYGLHISDIRDHASAGFGKFVFVGNVPSSLAYAGSLDDIKKVRKFGFIGNLKQRVHLRLFDTVADAIAAANEVKAELCSSPQCACREIFAIGDAQSKGEKS